MIPSNATKSGTHMLESMQMFICSFLFHFNIPAQNTYQKKLERMTLITGWERGAVGGSEDYAIVTNAI